MALKKIAITCGDPSGVGIEIIEKWVCQNPELSKKVIVIGPEKWVKTLPCETLSCSDSTFEIEPGKPNAQGQIIAFESMKSAAAGVKKMQYSAVVTAPINKANMRKIGYVFPGQTEFFESEWGGKAVMGFSGESLNVVLNSWHIPFVDVPKTLTLEKLSRSVSQAVFLAQKIKRKANPKIAICGLNPHAGENGILGREEIEIINPILKKIRNDDVFTLSDCLPADTVFFRQREGEFDACVALYHDQALAPLKTLEFDSAVNISLGLPFVRTSPDHGTAYDIAGKGIASIKSFDAAIQKALLLIL